MSSSRLRRSTDSRAGVTAPLDSTCYPRSGITASLAPPPRFHSVAPLLARAHARDALLHMIPRILAAVLLLSGRDYAGQGNSDGEQRFREARTCAWNIHLGIFRP